MRSVPASGSRRLGGGAGASPTLGPRVHPPTPTGPLLQRRPSPAWPPSCRCSPSSASGSRPPGTSSRWSAARCATRSSAAPRPDLDFTTDAPPDADRGAAARLGRRALGHRPRVRHDRRAQARRRHVVVEVTTYRADAYDRTDRASRRWPSATPSRTTWCGATSRSTRWRCGCPTLEFVDPHGGLADLAPGVLRTPGTPEESFADDPLRMMRAARFAAQLGFAVGPRGRGGDDRDGRAARDRLGRAGARRAGQAAAGAAPPGRPASCSSTPAWPTHVLPELPALRLEIDEHHRHKDVYEHSLTVLEQAIAWRGRRTGRRSRCPGPTSCCGWPRCCTTSASRATRRFEDGGGVSLPPPRGGRRQAGGQAAEGAALRQGHDQGGRPAGRAAPALPRLRRRASGPTRPCAATSPTPARCCRGCTG